MGPRRTAEAEQFTDGQILAIVKEGEAGRKVADLCRTLGITEQTYSRWKAKYGGMELSEMQLLKQVEDENRRLKQIVAEQTLDIQALKAIVAKSGRPHRSARGGGVAADARHESASDLSSDRAQHVDVAVSTTEQRDEPHRPRTAPGARRCARAVWVSASAHPARARGGGGESQARAPHLSGRRAAGACRRRKRPTGAERVPLPPASQRLERWSMDFSADTLADGRYFRTLNIVDDFTRECVAIEVDRARLDRCRFSAGWDPRFSKPFPPELFRRLTAFSVP